MSDAATMRERALAAARGGRPDEATRLFEEAAARHPHDAALLNSIGSFHAGRGDATTALAWFDRALAREPAHVEAALNRAVVLVRLDRPREAARLLLTREAALRHHPRYWTGRGAAELTAGDPAAAQHSYDTALRATPGNARAIQGRAQVALERGADDAIAWHERALAAVPGDRFVVRALAQAHAAAGRMPEALALTQALATQVPDWVEGLEAHATMRWAAGERDNFCDHFAQAAARAPSPALYAGWAVALAGVDRHGQAARVAAEGRRRWPGDRALASIELTAAGMTGDRDRAAAIIAGYDDPSPDWATHRARHLLRTGDPAAAEAVLATVVAEAPDDVAAWSLRDVAWRLLGDARHGWLSGQEGLVREMALDLAPDDFATIAALLDILHDRAAMPIGQSVKQGSQTRGALFARAEPAIATLAAAIARLMERYRRGLPPPDATHPLLRHRDAAWRIAGSWSIRLHGEGRHAAHIHPQGIVSSATYFAVPGAIDAPDRAGWLEIGRPPSDLLTSLAPIATVRPRAGHGVLFPSTLFHGTRPIAAGKRMSVAFDIAAD